MPIEDHPLVRAAPAGTLTRHGIEVTGQAATAEEALALMQDTQPDIGSVYIDLPGMDGIALVSNLVSLGCQDLALMLPGSADEANVPSALRAGAAGYLTRVLSPDAPGRRSQGAMQGRPPTPRKMAARVIHVLAAGRGRLRSSRSCGEAGPWLREQAVLDLAGTGLTDREMGDRRGISPREVGHLVGNVLDRLSV